MIKYIKELINYEEKNHLKYYKRELDKQNN